MFENGCKTLLNIYRVGGAVMPVVVNDNGAT